MQYDRTSEKGLDIVGFYHSHPGSPAILSAIDLEGAWNQAINRISRMSFRSAVALRSRSLALQPGRFEGELVEMVDERRAAP